MTKRKTVMVTARLNEDLVRSMREVSAAADLNVTDIVERAVRDWLTLFIHANRVAAGEVCRVAADLAQRAKR